MSELPQVHGVVAHRGRTQRARVYNFSLRISRIKRGLLNTIKKKTCKINKGLTINEKQGVGLTHL